MFKVSVMDWEGKSHSQLDLNKEIFSVKLDKPLLHSVVTWQRAKKRKGTHSVKTRSKVRGGGKKPFRQKGTGNARQGSSRSPLLEGGGVIHGPEPRSYEWSLPKKIRRKALGMTLSWLYKEKRFVVVKDMTSSDGKTKNLSSRFKKMGWETALLVDDKKDVSFQRACKNLSRFKFISAEGLNVYDLLKFNRVVLTPESLKTIYRKCGHVSAH